MLPMLHTFTNGKLLKNRYGEPLQCFPADCVKKSASQGERKNSSEDDSEEEIQSWSWDPLAIPSQGILKMCSCDEEDEVDVGILRNPLKKPHPYQVKFILTPEQEAKAELPYREGYEEARRARKAQRAIAAASKAEQEAASTLDDSMLKMKKDMDVTYIKKWNRVLEDRIPSFKECGVDPRTKVDPEAYIEEVYQVITPFPEFSQMKFARKFRRVVFSPPKITP